MIMKVKLISLLNLHVRSKLEKVLVIIVIAVIIAVMIKRKNDSEEDEESGDKLNETAASMTYQPGNSRSEIQE